SGFALLVVAAFAADFVENVARAVLIAHVDVGTSQVELGGYFVGVGEKVQFALQIARALFHFLVFTEGEVRLCTIDVERIQVQCIQVEFRFRRRRGFACQRGGGNGDVVIGQIIHLANQRVHFLIQRF